MEWVLWLDIVSEPLVGEVKNLLHFSSLICFDEPHVFLSIEVSIVSLLNILRCGEVWHGLEVVSRVNLSHFRVTVVVENAEEGWALKLVGVLLVGVGSSSEL